MVDESRTRRESMRSSRAGAIAVRTSQYLTNALGVLAVVATFVFLFTIVGAS